VAARTPVDFWKAHRTGSKQVHHPVVGDLDLTFEAMGLASEPGLQMLAFSAAPGSQRRAAAARHLGGHCPA
jgi:hypothetical protein